MHVKIPYNLKLILQQTRQLCRVTEILLSLMYSGMVLMVVCWHFFHANGCISMLMNVTFYAKILNEGVKSVNECRFNKMNVFSRQ